MASSPLPRDCSDFEIAVVCALELEAQCVCDVLDKVWKDQKYGSALGDDNAYTLGVIGKHNVVVVHMPGMGTIRAASAASSLKMSFKNIKLVLVVGICGGMPYGTNKEEIVLGDVVISKALVHYNFGKQYPLGFERKTDVLDTLGAPSEKILAFLAKLGVKQHMLDMQNDTAAFLHVIQQASPQTRHPGTENDILYQSSYAHRHRLPSTCDACQRDSEICQDAVRMECEDLGCESVMHVARQRLINTSTTQPVIHIGNIGSGDTVMKSGHHRDMLAQREGIVAVEMEGAGVWRHGPSLVIKGVCDYADSHKRKGWQLYAAATAAACTKAFLARWPSETRQGRSVGEPREDKYHLVPRQQVKKFFGREDELARIADHFKGTHDRPQIVVLHAMGGQGKSQIALEYCRRHRGTYRGVFWIDASSPSTITQALAGIAYALDRSAAAVLPDDDARVGLVLRTVEHWEHRWLMVFDNCDDAATFSEVEQFLPQAGNGNILFTSRNRDLEELCELIEVPPMPLNFGVELLLHRYKGFKIDDYMSEGGAIVDRLGGLALAIDQASAYMHYIHLPLDKLRTFLPRYLTERTKILQHTTRNFWKYTRANGPHERETAINAFTTWEMSFQQLLDSSDQQDSVAHFLTLSAFLGPIAVDESLFRLYFAMSDPPPDWFGIFTVPLSEEAVEKSKSVALQQDTSAKGHLASDLSRAISQIDFDGPQLSWSADHFWQFVHQASQMSLLQSISPAIELEGSSFLLHPLIRDWLQLRLTSAERQIYNRRAVDVIFSSIVWVLSEGGSAESKSMILQHIGAALASDSEFFADEHRIGQDLSTCSNANLFAAFYRECGQHDASLSLFRTVAETRERAQGPEHPDTLMSMNNLATVLIHQGHYTEAEKMCRAVVEASKRVQGPEHSFTLASANNLAMVMLNQGQYIEAEKIYRVVVEASERVLGREHPNTLISMNNLAMVLMKQGHYTEAEKSYRTLVEASEKVLGQEHPNTLINKNNLAQVLVDQGQDQCIEAEKIFRVVLEARERILGPEHPETLMTINNLAMMLTEQGHCHYTEAEKMQRMVIDAQERALGREHPDTLMSMSNLAIVLERQGQCIEALQIYRTLVEVSGRVLGQEHPQTLVGMNNLAVALSGQGQGQDIEAEKILRIVLETLERVLGQEHPRTTMTMNSLALLLSNQDRYSEAETIQRQVVESALVTLGRQHPQFQQHLDSLRNIWRGQGQEDSDIEDAVRRLLGTADEPESQPATVLDNNSV